MKKKLLATMAVVPLLGAFGTTEVLAATTKSVDDWHTDIEGDNSNTTQLPSTFDKETTVKIYQDSTFQVVIPKTITLEKDPAQNGTYKEDYQVEVTGDINGSEVVTVKPVESSNTTTSNSQGKVDITMNEVSGGKTALTAVVDQPETTARWNDLFNNATKTMDGNITVSGVTAGEWLGTFDFEISLK